MEPESSLSTSALSIAETAVETPQLFLSRNWYVEKYALVWAALAVALMLVLANLLKMNLNLQAPHFYSNWAMILGIGVETYVLCRYSAAMAGRKRNSPSYNLTLSLPGLEWHTGTKANGKKIVPWNDVQYVGLSRGKHHWWPFFRSPTSLVIDCDNIADYSINIDALSPTRREQLFRMLSLKLPQDVFAPEVLYLQVQALLGDSAANVDGFTAIWAEEFNRRFELANHVTLEVGRKCSNDRYTIRLLMGTRINSSVYLASGPQGESVVVKELVIPVNTESVIAQKLIEQFEREAEVLTGLDHENIVKVKDHFVEHERSYLVMSCAPGLNLREYVRQNGNTSQGELLVIAEQLVSVLQYLHGREPAVLHRDFTPDNIVYSASDRRLKVIDFGAANLYATKGTATIVGKQGFMPPEQFKGHPSPASDIYALGATLRFIATGDDPAAVAQEAASSECLSLAMAELIEKCLRPQPQDRPTADQLASYIALLQTSADAKIGTV